jgi:hypothetical protein
MRGLRGLCLLRRVLSVVLTSLALVVLAVPAVAGGGTVVAVRIADHPGYVRVVLDVTAGTISSGQVTATDPSPVDGSAALVVVRSGIATAVPHASGDGIAVTLNGGAGRARVTLHSAKGRFKYLSYAVVGGNRLAIDLWKSAPPSNAAEIRSGTGGCLTLTSAKVVPYLASASGTDRNLFENQFNVVLRGANGAVLASRHMAATGAWSAQLSYLADRRQAGTLEADALSAKDGALVCLVQLRVTVQASPSGTVHVLARYPAACLKAVGRPAGAGLIAAVQPTGQVRIASPAGGTQILLPVKVATGNFPPVNEPAENNVPPQVQWSPDGRLLALDDGTLWHADGTSAGRLFVKLAWLWSWSPTADCAIGVSTLGSLSAPTTISLGVPGRPPVPFLRGKIYQFAFSPNGRTLVIVVGDNALNQHFFVLDLATGQLREIAVAPDSAHSVILGSWAPRDVLLFWSGPGASILADGTQLRGVDFEHGGRLITYGTGSVVPSPQALARCGTREIAVIGAGRPYPTITRKQLAYVAPGAASKAMTPAILAYVAPVCSPDNVDIVAVQYKSGGSSSGPARLAVLKADGRFLFYLSPSTGFTDTAPEWAAPGILYGRTPIGTSTAQLWFAPFGGGSHDTGLRATAWDWSATPPSGIG